MGKALALSEPPGDRHQIVTFNDDQIALIKSQVCKPRDREATDDELALFLHQAQRTGLDPLSKQVYAIFRWDGRARSEKMTVQTGIDGFRLIAQRTGQYAGRPAPLFMDAQTGWTEVWLKDTPPAAAKAIVRKLMPGGIIADTEAIATWAEYYPGEGPAGQMWRSRPSGQLAKCAEALALRAAFPNDLSGLYTSEEMDQADARGESAPRQAAKAPQPREVQHGPAENPQTVTTPPPVVEGTATEVPTSGLPWPPVQPHPDLPDPLQSLRNEAIAAVQVLGTKFTRGATAFMAKQIDKADQRALDPEAKNPAVGYESIIKAAQQHEAQSQPASRA